MGDGTVVAKSSPSLILGGRKYTLVKKQSTNDITLDVVAGESYEISYYGTGFVYFGEHSIASNADHLEIEYNY